MKKRSLADAEVVLEAADWHQFIDPVSKIALLSTDLENLGVRPDFSRQKITQCLGRALASKRIPPMIQWTHNYIKANQPHAEVVCLELLKFQASECARGAIRQVLEFCRQDASEIEAEEKAPEKPLTLGERIWRKIFGK
jgi:hypothetical protein